MAEVTAIDPSVFPAGRMPRIDTYANRGTPTRIYELFYAQGSADSDDDGLYVSNGTTDNTNWERPQIGPASSSVLHNFSATTNPGVGDDSADGYSVGSQWINVTLDRLFVCLDNTAGAAIWTVVGQSELNNFSATTNPGTGDDDADGYAVGSLWVNTSTDQGFVCLDASTGAAVWEQISGVPVGTGYAPFFIGNLSGNWNVYTSTNLAIDWDDEVLDPDGEHDTVTNPDRINFANQSNGLYRVDLDLVWDQVSNASGLNFTVYVQLSGTTVGSWEIVCDDSSNTQKQTQLSCYVNVTSQSTQYVNAYTTDNDLTGVCYLRGETGSNFRTTITVTRVN